MSDRGAKAYADSHELIEEEFELPADQRLTLAAYDAGPPPVAYVEPIAVAETLPDMPIFLKADHYVPAPLVSKDTRVPCRANVTKTPTFLAPQSNVATSKTPAFLS